MTALGWVAVRVDGIPAIPFRLAQPYIDNRTPERHYLALAGVAFVWPEVPHVTNFTGDLYDVVGLTNLTRDGHTKLKLRAHTPAR